MKKIIALLTDFGSRGQHYVASMKGVILNINPNVKIIDITHNISFFSIIEASYLIKSTYKYFPKETVFIIVVDPGVGTNREILIIRTKSKHFIIGPNNGIFSNIIKLENIVECVNVSNKVYFNKPVSTTFHGRDIMAPVGAHITRDIPIKEFGPRFNHDKILDYSLHYDVNEKKKKIECVIQYIDSFGNAITNVPIRNDFVKGTTLFLKHDSSIKIEFGDQSYVCRYVTHFGSVPINMLTLLKGSTNFLEIAKNQANAAKDIGFNVGDIITLNL